MLDSGKTSIFSQSVLAPCRKTAVRGHCVKHYTMYTMVLTRLPRAARSLKNIFKNNKIKYF